MPALPESATKAHAPIRGRRMKAQSSPSLPQGFYTSRRKAFQKGGKRRGVQAKKRRKRNAPRAQLPIPPSIRKLQLFSEKTAALKRRTLQLFRRRRRLLRCGAIGAHHARRGRHLAVHARDGFENAHPELGLQELAFDHELVARLNDALEAGIVDPGKIKEALRRPEPSLQ